MREGVVRRRWTPEEDALLRCLYDQKSAAEIAARLSRTSDSIWIRARGLGLAKAPEQISWTEEELDDVRRNYGIDRPQQIARRLGRTPSATYQQARALGLLSAKGAIIQSTVHDYFAAVTSPEQAYVLGLLAADGNVGSEHPRIIFGLQAKDRALVGWVRDRLNPGANLSVNANGFASLQVTSRQMVADLAMHGVVPRKSRIMNWPCHLGELQRPYLLGYFDGDGSMFLPRDRHGTKRPGWNVCSGTEQFLVDMRAYILAAAGVRLQAIQHRVGADLWQVSVTGAGAVVLDEWLHQDGLGLPRKRLPAEVVARYKACLPPDRQG